MYTTGMFVNTLKYWFTSPKEENFTISEPSSKLPKPLTVYRLDCMRALDELEKVSGIVCRDILWRAFAINETRKELSDYYCISERTVYTHISRGISFCVDFLNGSDYEEK